MENRMEVPQKIRHRITKWSNNPTLGYIYISKKFNSGSQDTCTLMFTAALFTATKTWKQLKCPSMDKENVNTHTPIHTAIVFSHKKWGYPAIYDNLDGSRPHYAKWNRSEKDKYCMMSLTFGISKNRKSKTKPKFLSSSLWWEKMFIKSAPVIMAATVTLLTPIKIIFNYSPRDSLFLYGSYKTISLIQNLCTSLFWTWIRFLILHTWPLCA